MAVVPSFVGVLLAKIEHHRGLNPKTLTTTTSHSHLNQQACQLLRGFVRYCVLCRRRECGGCYSLSICIYPTQQTWLQTVTPSSTPMICP